MSFDAIFNSERFFLMFLLPKKCQKIGFLNLCRRFQKNFIQLHKQQKRIGLGHFNWVGLPAEGAESNSGYAGLYIGVLTKILFGCRAIFSNYSCPLR